MEDHLKWPDTGNSGARARMSPGTEKSWSDSVGTNGPLSVVALRYTIDVPDVVHELLVAELALEKLGARSISAVEAEQMLRNPHGGDGLDTRRLMIGLTDGGRFLTLVIRAD